LTVIRFGRRPPGQVDVLDTSTPRFEGDREVVVIEVDASPSDALYPGPEL
jgi:hypothetical protein